MTEIELAKWIHENYEEIAKTKGWNTQENCKVEFDNLPQQNKETMIEIAKRLLNFNLLHQSLVIPHLPDGLVEGSNCDDNFKAGWIACWNKINGN